MYDTDFLYGPKMNEFFHNVVKELLNLYSKFAPMEKVMLTKLGLTLHIFQLILSYECELA